VGGQQQQRRGIPGSVRGAHVAVEYLIERSRLAASLELGAESPDRRRQPCGECRDRRFKQPDVAPGEDPASHAHLQDGAVRRRRRDVRTEGVAFNDVRGLGVTGQMIAGDRDRRAGDEDRRAVRAEYGKTSLSSMPPQYH
jgi:hypothetical protein